MQRSSAVLACTAMACLLAAAAASAQPASAQTTSALGVPQVCLVDATGVTTTVTKEMCGIEVPADTFLDTAFPAEYKVGTHKVEWNGLTDAGLRMSETHTIIVMDLTPPDIPPPPEVTYEATGPTSEPALGDIMATDINLKSTTNNAWPFPVGAHKVTWTAKDKSGLVATATQSVQIADTTKPTITCEDVRIKSAVAVPLSAAGLEAAFSDIVDGDKTLTPPASTPDPLPHGTVTKVLYGASDSSGNAATPCEQNVYVLSPSAFVTLPQVGVEGNTFGTALAVSTNTVFVGDPGHDHTTTSDTPTTTSNSGLVYVYGLTPGSSQYTETKIVPGTPKKDLNFGSALAVIPTDDGEVLAVGAPGKDTNKGEVYLYNPKTGTLTDTIQNPNPDAGNHDHFGAALATMGDKLVVGAHMYDHPAPSEENIKRDSGRVYVYDLDGEKQYEIPNPSPDRNGRFGKQVEATVEGKTERIYVGSQTDGTTIGVVYVYDVTKAKTTGIVRESTFPRPSGSGFTEFATEQIRPTEGGGVYVGEPAISTGGKIHEFAADNTRNEFTPPASHKTKFGKSFDADDRLLYAGTQRAGAAQPLHAFHLSDRTYGDEYSTDGTPAGYYSERFAHTIETSGNWVAVAEILEKFTPSDDLAAKSHVKVLDLRTMAPDLVYPAPTGSPSPAPGSPDQSRALPGATQPAQPQMTQVLEAPKLLSTELLSTGKIRLTYDAAIDPLEVDRDDYVMSDASLEVMAAEVSGSTITLTYAGGGSSGAGAEPPGVELVGGIGHY